MVDTMTLEELRESLDVGCLPNTDRPRWFEAIDAAIKQRDHGKRDAARYRWLREHHDSTRPDWHVRTPTNDAPAIGALDAAIDAAMAKESGR